MLFILYGGHTGMGNAGRNFFRQNGVSIVKKYHYCEESPELTTFYESRNYVDKLTFYENTDPMYRYRIGNIQTGFSRLQIIDAVSGKEDYLLTLSTDNLDIIRDLKFTYKDAVQVIYAYTDDTTLEKIFSNMDISKEELELRCSIGRMIKACYRSNPALFDYTIVFDSPFDYENMVNQCNTFYIKTQKVKDDMHEELLKCVQEIKRTVTETNQTVSEMNQTLKTLVEFFRNGLQSWLQHEKQWFSQTANNEDDEGLIAASVARSNYYINEHVSSAESLVQAENESLRQIFGTTWALLLPESQASLISAGVLWKSCASITKPGFDFSGVIISATSALEMELKHIFYSNFQDFLEERYGAPDAKKVEQTFQNWPEILLDKKKGIEKGNYFTLGRLPYILGKSEKNTNQKKEELLRTRLEEYLSTIVIDKYSKDPIGAFYRENNPDCIVNRCMFINGEYRIKAAHTDVVEREQADDCYQQVIVGKADALEHTAHVTGLIIELYDMLK